MGSIYTDLTTSVSGLSGSLRGSSAAVERGHCVILPELPVNWVEFKVQRSGQYCGFILCVLQLYGVAPMASAVKRSALACWSATVCWMHVVVLVAAVSEHDEGLLLLFSSHFDISSYLLQTNRHLQRTEIQQN